MNTKSLSSFAQSAISLDADFVQLERLSVELEKLDLETESGLERAKKLLSLFGETGLRVGDGIQALARTLEESRAGAEKAAALVSARAGVIQERQRISGELFARFQSLGEMVKKVTEAVALLQGLLKSGLPETQTEVMNRNLPEIDTQLGVLIDEAKKLHLDAREAKLKSLERDSDALAQSLGAMRARIGGFVSRPDGATLQ